MQKGEVSESISIQYGISFFLVLMQSGLYSHIVSGDTNNKN